MVPVAKKNYRECSGFEINYGDNSVFTDREIFIASYVNDLIITGLNLPAISHIRDELKKMFEMKNKNKARIVLGICIQRSCDGTITIDRAQYAASVVEAYLVESDRLTLIPMKSSTVTILAKIGHTLFPNLVIYT